MAPSPPFKSCSLTEIQKQKIVAERERRRFAGEPYDQVTLSEWAVTQFRLLRKPSQPTMSRLLRHVLHASLRPRAIHKRNRYGVCRELEQVLHSWVNAQFSARRGVKGTPIIKKADQLQTMMNKDLSAEKRTFLRFSNGWLQNFQKRCNLKSLISHRGSGDVSQALVDRELPTLRAEISAFDMNDVFNCDGFGHFYRMAPDRTIAHTMMPRRKKQKIRLTYLACCNATGSERLPLMCIGKAERQRCFKKRYGIDFGFDYHNNKRAWMTSSLFFQWLMRFSSFITRTNPDRRISLLMDNCAAHGSLEFLPNFDIVKYLLLPPNTTSKLQPLDTGIIAAVKTRYRRYQYERALDCIDANVENKYNIDQLSYMRAIRNIWKQLPAVIISNCWKHTGLMQESSVVVLAEDNEEDGIQAAVNQLVLSRARMCLQTILNPIGEDDVIETINDEQLASVAVAARLGESMTIEDGDAENEVSFIENLSFDERLRCIVVVRRMLEDLDYVDSALGRSFQVKL